MPSQKPSFQIRLPSANASPFHSAFPSPLPSDHVFHRFPRLATGTKALQRMVVAVVFLLVTIVMALEARRGSWAPSSLFSSSGPVLRDIDISSRPLPMNATLAQRLRAWRDSPGARGADFPGELDLEEFNKINQETCANVWPSHSGMLFDSSQELWRSLDRAALHHHRTRLINHLEDLDLKGATKDFGSGRGIVFTAGNADTLERVLYCVRMLRHVHHSKLPVQVFHFPSERQPEDSVLVKELTELGGEMIEAVGAQRDETRLKNYHLKALSIVQAPWREVLYLDSDNIPAIDPEYMFEAPPYKRLRSMFWPDYWKTAATNPIWAILGIRCRDEFEQEAGQILIDKKYHLDAMLLAQHMLEDWPFWFSMSDGDKDIFRFAFLALRKRWAVPGRYLGAGSLPGDDDPLCGLTMMQYDHVGKPLFVHYNLLKQTQHSIHQNYTFGRTKQFPMFLAPKGVPEVHTSPFLQQMRDRTQDVEDPAFEDLFHKERGYGDVDADMLADADDLGRARAPASEEVRRRAVTERGARAFFRPWNDLPCIDTRWDDPRPDPSRDHDRALIETERKRLEKIWRNKGLRPSDPGWGHPDPKLAAANPLGLDWEDIEQFEVVRWSDDERLRNFEEELYKQGFVPNEDRG